MVPYVRILAIFALLMVGCRSFTIPTYLKSLSHRSPLVVCPKTLSRSAKTSNTLPWLSPSPGFLNTETKRTLPALRAAEEGTGGKLSWIEKFPPKTQKTIKIIGAGAAVFTVLFALMRFKWLSGLLSGLVVAAVTTFSIAATILPLLPVILPVAAGFLILKVLWALFNDDDDDLSSAKRR
mmetsp:Transcript_53056/g.125305  ORF Transcript_53056/g.125305 Transcript_53056/m.125305 type:complete len:180 (+) Transcript_53056:226-765(+)